MTFNRRNKSKSNSGKTQSNQNNKKNNSSGKPNGRNQNNAKASDFKFQLHDSGNKRAHTFEKIREAIILKIQTDFQSGRHVVTLLRNKVKSGPPTPTRETSSKTDADERELSRRQ